MEPFMLSKLFDFSGNTIMKILSLIFKILIIIGIPALVIWTVYAGLIRPTTKPNPTTTVEAGGEAISYTIHVGFGGCARLPVVGDRK